MKKLCDFAPLWQKLTQKAAYFRRQMNPVFPKIGDLAPAFEALTDNGAVVLFPRDWAGKWVILFAHPSNFTSAWLMYSTFLALKERHFDGRNAKLLGICSERPADGSMAEKAKRYIGIFLKGPVIEDPDRVISQLFGLASWRNRQPGHDRAAYIVGPDGTIRHIISSPFTLQSVAEDLEKNLDDLQGLTKKSDAVQPDPRLLIDSQERADGLKNESYLPSAAHFSKKEFGLN